jgi:hypothetical protein
MSETCRWCDAYHGPTCPTVKAIEFHPDGSIKRVEFKTANDYPQQAIGQPSTYWQRLGRNPWSES